MKQSNPRDEVNNFTGDMLVIYGGNDVVVSPTENKNTLLAFPFAKEIFIEKANHGYGFSGEEPYITKIVEDSFTSFFKEKLK